VRRDNWLHAEQGGIAPVFLIVLTFMLLLGWILAGATARHALQATYRAREIVAGQLAQGGLEVAIALIDEGGTPPGRLEGTEETGAYVVTITPSGRGTYLVESIGTSGERQRGIRAEVAPPAEPFTVLAGGDARLAYVNGLSVGGETRIVGDINAHGNVDLSVTNALLGLSTLRVQGDIRAGEGASISARTDLASVPLGLIAGASALVEGSLGAGGDILLTTGGGLLTSSSIAVTGPVTYGGELVHTREGLLGSHSVDLGGAVNPEGGVTLPAIERGDVAFYEALVAELEESGRMRLVGPDEGCGTIVQHTRVTGDMNCADLQVEDGAVLVVDGSLQVSTARVQGLVYVRGGASPDPRGDATVQTLSLLELVHSVDPAAGSGALIATGNIDIAEGKLARLLSFGSNVETVLQVLALSTGPDDAANDLSFGMGGLADALSSGEAAPLFLYAGGAGDIRVHDARAVGAIAFTGLPMIAVAGGDIDLELGGLVDAVSQLSLKARPEVWRQVAPFLEGMGRARVLSWEWLPSLQPERGDGE